MHANALSLLIADDDLGDRKQIRRALKQSGLVDNITEVSDIEEALSACEKDTFDCAIVDYQMPGQNGLEGVVGLRELQPYMAIVMITGQGDEMIASEAFKRGVSDYLPKRVINAESISRILASAVEKTALRQKVDEQREALESFAHILVHDLSGPINHIRAFGEMMTEAVETGNFSEVPELHSYVDGASKRMEELIETLMEYNKADGGNVEFKDVSLRAVIDAATANLSVAIGEREARITTGTLPEVYGNEPMLIQVCQNLIGNGIKYCDESVPTVHVDAVKRDESWCISVRDNGIGISEKYRQVIFNPFRRLHSIDDYSGTGLGLATCKKIVERHNGKIWCESEVGKGTVFYLLLPSR